VLRGYVDASYAVASNSGDYVDEVLRPLDIQAGFDPRPRPFSFDPGGVLSRLGWTITASDRHFVVQMTERHLAAEGEDVGAAAVQLMLALALLDVDCGALRNYVFPNVTSSERFPLQILSIVVFGAQPQLASEAAPTTSCIVTIRWETLLRKLAPNRQALNSGVYLKALTAVLASLEPQTAATFVAGMVDWCDFFALVADTATGKPKERVRLSLKAAQLSCILCQRPFANARAAEIVCATVTQRHNWLHALRAEDAAVDLALLRFQVTYSHSRALLFMQVFRQSAAEASVNPLHSLRWKALMLCRRSLAAIGGADVLASPPAAAGDYEAAERRAHADTLMTLARVLTELALTAIANGEQMFLRFGGGQAGDLLIEELGVLTEFQKAASEVNDESREKLARVNRFYRGTPWRWLQSHGIWALWR
jgi:hypothetical protein